MAFDLADDKWRRIEDHPQVLPVTKQTFTGLASHWASSEQSQNAPPLGMRMGLKAGFDISGFPPNDQVILTALKQYGLIVADNDGAMFISGAPASDGTTVSLISLKHSLHRSSKSS